MLSPRRLVLSLVALATPLASACGGPPAPTHDVTSLPSATASASAAPTVDLSPVPMPSAVVVVLHAAHVGASADMLGEWAGQPMSVEEPLTEMVGERLAKLVDTDSAADMVVTAHDRGGRHDPDMRLGVALPVKDFDAAKATLQGDYGLTPLANGAFEITRKGGHHHRDGDPDFHACALAPAEGGGRIVCSKDATSRDAVLPYLTRGVSTFKSIKSDLHIEARPGPFRDMVTRERASIVQSGSHFLGSNQGLQSTWEAALGDLADSFLDLDKATFDANIDAKLGTAELKVTAKEVHGGFARLLAGHPDRAAPAPAVFLKLPGDADIAWFAHGLDPAELTLPQAAIVGGIGAALADEPGFKDPDRKAFTDVVSHTLDLLGAPVIVYARGVDIAKAIPAVSGLTETSDAAKIKSGVEQAAGWDILGADLAGSSIGPDKVVSVFKEWMTVFARPAVVKDMTSGGMPVTWKVAPARNVPPGTVHVAMTVSHDDSENKPKKRPPILVTLHTFVVPDQTRVWIVSALDEATAAAKARALVGGTGTTLATREGLDALRSMRTNGGGFFTPRSVGMGLPVSWLFAENYRYRMANDPLMGISSQTQYTTPLVFTAAETTDGGHTLTLGMRVPRAVVQDALQVGPHIFH